MSATAAKELKLAMLGMVDGNGHPYSWSAIVNGGYDEEAMRANPYRGIYDYLQAEPKENLGIPGARVTHIWTDDPADAPLVAKASLIDHVVPTPEAVIGEVDAVVVATDKGHEHVARCRPFIEAGLPVFIDKPLVDNEADLATFITWHREGKRFLSTSALRYAIELESHRRDLAAIIGEPRFITVTTAKSWERYGIHALEYVYPVLGPGFVSVRNSGTPERNVVHLKHGSRVDVVISANSDMYGAFGAFLACGTKATSYVKFEHTYFAFKRQLEVFVDFLRTGTSPVPFAETVELMKLVIAGIRSRDEGGREVALAEIGGSLA
jgi:predicted dehydrogenase